MDFEATFPLRVYLNLARSDLRRHALEAHFLERGLEVRRQPAVAARWLRDAKGYQDVSRRAKALSKRLALRRATLAGVPALFLFEDDVVLHPGWREKLATISLPVDWGIFMLGAFHQAAPVAVADGVVRCTHAVDNHAIGIRAAHFSEIRTLLRGHSSAFGASLSGYSDQRLAKMQDRIPTYAVWPNLAWQNDADAPTNYDEHGMQKVLVENIRGLAAAMMRFRQPGNDAGAPIPEDPECKHPWMDSREAAAIEHRLRPDMTMLEYGSGRSTEYFARLVRNYCSIEHDGGWHDRVKPRAEAAGVRLSWVPPLWPQSEPFAAALPGQFTGYVEAWREFGTDFDAVLIDGRARVDAALSVADGLKPGGRLFFHDFFSRERYWKRLPELERLYRLVEAVRDTEQTLAVFERL